MSDKITLVTFGKVEAGTAGTQNESYTLAKRLHEAGRLHRLVCMDSVAADLPVPMEMVLPDPRLERWHRQFRRLLFKIDAYCTLPGKRRLFEQSFDFLVRHSGCLDGASVLLFNRPGFPETVRTAQRAGIPTIALASVLHPEFNARLVKAEQQKYGLPERSVYTDAGRVSNLSRFYSGLDHLIVQSPLSQRIYSEQGLDPAKIHLLDGSYPIDTDRFIPGTEARPDEKFRVVHLSHMNLIKGIGYLLEAWKKLDTENAELVLAGTVDPDVRAVIDRIGAPNVVETGPVADPVALLQQADVFVSPSISDSFPFTILEAMSCGTVVVSSAHCGLSCLLNHGEDGFVYRFDDVAALAGHLDWCRMHRDRLPEMGAALRAKAIAGRDADPAGRILDLVDRITD